MQKIYKSLPRAPYGVVAIGIILLGLAGLISREGLVVSFLTFALGTASLPYAYSETKRAAMIPFLVGTALVLVGGVSQLGPSRGWFGLAVGCAGIASFLYGGAAELPRGRRGDWDQPFGGRDPKWTSTTPVSQREVEA